MKASAHLTFTRKRFKTVFDIMDDNLACEWAQSSPEVRFIVVDEENPAAILYEDGEVAEDRSFLNAAVFRLKSDAEGAIMSTYTMRKLKIVTTPDAALARYRHNVRRLEEMDAL